jgi:hypothetical protein
MLTYHVTIAAAQAAAPANPIGGVMGNMTIHTATPTALGLPPVGNQINSCWMGGGAPPAGENSCNLNAVVVLVSHGENGWGGYTSAGGQVDAPTAAAELKNVKNVAADTAFVKGDPNATGFDDVVFAWSPDDLLDPLTRQNTVRSAMMITNDTLRNNAIAISNAMVNAVVAPNVYVIPGASPVAMPNDAWGTALVYASPNAGASLCGLPAGAVVFTVTSLGMDRTAGLNPNTNRNDDITISVTVDPLKQQINNRAGFAC